MCAPCSASAGPPEGEQDLKHLLIVEDQAEIRLLIRMTLEYRRYTIAEAHDAAGALSAIARHRPDLVLLDVTMPGDRSGLEVCASIKRDALLRSIPVVLITARGQQADREAGFAAGADACLEKPFGPLNLIETVERLLLPPVSKRPAALAGAS